MLILTRSVSEKIVIGDDIKIIILSVKGEQIRIGIEAPKRIPVHREEVYRRIKAEETKNEHLLTVEGSDIGTLILTRGPDEAIMIGDHIEVRVLNIQGKQVRMGITAPREIPVHREEIQMKLQAEAINKGNVLSVAQGELYA